MSMGIRASRSTRKTPMCAMPRANPPARAMPIFGRVAPLRPWLLRRSSEGPRSTAGGSPPFFSFMRSIVGLRGGLPNTRLTRACRFCNLFCRTIPDCTGLIMTQRIQKAAVLGAGTMGARIAAHFANAGLPCLLLDIVPKDAAREGASSAERNKLVTAGIEAAKKSRPAAFFTPALAGKISVGNFEDDLPRIADADWIIEVVAENLEIKAGLLAKVAQHRKPGAIVTTNTSGLPVHLIAQGLPEEFQQHWAGTHFFNPPRYMKLVEIIRGPKTNQDVLKTLQEFCDRRLGKGVVFAKDTPNFIANRIGTFSMLNALRLMEKLDMTIEEVDACTGPAVGWPKSATFRTADIVGLDVLVHVGKNIYERGPNDESHEMYRVPALVQEMAGRKWLGDKTGQGFYKKEKSGSAEKEILTLDLKTMEYRE